MIKIFAALALALCLFTVVASAHDSKEGIRIKYLIFREDCYESFFTRFDFTSDKTCLQFSFSKLVGYAIISLSIIYKLPQIIKIVNAGSSKGVTASSYYFETIVFANTLGYSRHLSLPFSVYGETIIILAQNFIVLLLIYKYDKTIGLGEKIGFVAFIGGYLTVLLMDTIVPEHIWPFVSSSCIIFNVMSRIPQIYSTFQAKSTGQLAFLTFFLAWAGSVARLATILIESDDLLYKA